MNKIPVLLLFLFLPLTTGCLEDLVEGSISASGNDDDGTITNSTNVMTTADDTTSTTAMTTAGPAGTTIDTEYGSDSDSDSTTAGTDTETSESTETSDATTTGISETGISETDTSETDTGEPIPPGPGEPCDPALADIPGYGCFDPEKPNLPQTCVPVPYNPMPNVIAYAFICDNLNDGEGDGADPGDPCTQALPNSCLNSYCLWNGDYLLQDPWGFPPGVCPWKPDGPNGPTVLACCAAFCNAELPCEDPVNYYCETNWPIPELPNYGVCVALNP